MPEIKDAKAYAKALLAAGVQRFDDEPRPCRTLRIVKSASPREIVELEIPIVLIEEDRVLRWAEAKEEAERFLKRRKLPHP